MKPRVRMFSDPETGKVWGTRTEGTSVTVISGTAKKLKEVEKPQTDLAAVGRFLEKEEGARLRKGMVLIEEEPPPGQPYLIRFLSKGYTGVLTLTALEGSLLTNLFGGEGDHLALIHPDGSGDLLAELSPGQLLRGVCIAPELGRDFLLVGHGVYQVDHESNELSCRVPENKSPASFLSVQNGVAAWYEEPDVVVSDLRQEVEIFRSSVTPQLYSGHTTQLTGALSPDAKLLALCWEAGVLLLHTLSEPGSVRRIEGDFEMVEKLAFTPDGRRLLFKERYGRSTLHAFEVDTGTAVADWPDFGDLAMGDFAIESDGERLAVTQGRRAQVYDLASLDLSLSIELDMVVKSAAVAWTDEGALGVRTDLGCVALYNAG
ncbi:MAG: hypothetical protein WC314_05335 [Vulcanimicrobiota bacterium]